LHDVKAGVAITQAAVIEIAGPTATVTHDARSFTLTAPGGEVTAVSGAVTAEWSLVVEPHGAASVSFTLDLRDEASVVHGAPGAWPPVGGRRGSTGDTRLDRWVDTALGDLDALRLTATGADDEFFAAGAPWFFTLFGR